MGPFLVDGHGAVVGEVSVVHHGVHVVTPDSEEGGPHTPGHRRHLHGSRFLGNVILYLIAFLGCQE